MKFVLFCEGATEMKALPIFLKRYLDEKLSEPIGISPVKFEGWSELYKDVSRKAHLRLKEGDVIAVISLLDLYGPTFYPGGVDTVNQRYDWAKKHIEGEVNHSQFRQFFAVHEVEAWLLSDPSIFPRNVANSFPGKAKNPETVNFNQPPAKLLDDLYTAKTKRGYKKVTQGKALFDKLDPNIAAKKCPRLKEMLDEMLRLAEAALQ